MAMSIINISNLECTKKSFIKYKYVKDGHPVDGVSQLSWDNLVEDFFDGDDSAAIDDFKLYIHENGIDNNDLFDIKLELFDLGPSNITNMINIMINSVDNPSKIGYALSNIDSSKLRQIMHSMIWGLRFNKDDILKINKIIQEGIGNCSNG